MTPRLLFATDGRFVAWYRPGLPHLWSRTDRWIGWFAWPGDSALGQDVADTAGGYLGTVVGERLLCRTYRPPVAPPERVPEPQRPAGPPDRADTGPIVPPPGFSDVPAARLR